ncbi:MAG: hypothetical protein JRE64_13330 [Deltaproteobacteria bacterium]|nr:hypothetical protein [Deltaproteobacteria bacterium]
MLRQARLDAPGILHENLHIKVGGLAKQKERPEAATSRPPEKGGAIQSKGMHTGRH